MNPAPRRGEKKAHTSLTVAPAVGWGQTSGLAPPTNSSYIHHSTGKVPCRSAPLQGLSKMTKWKNSPQKHLQEITTANELIKKDLKNITESEFRIIVIKLIAGLENSIKDSRQSLATEIKGLRNSQDELKNAINELKNKMETTMARIEEAEERTGELEDKIMEKEDAEKKR